MRPLWLCLSSGWPQTAPRSPRGQMQTLKGPAVFQRGVLLGHVTTPCSAVPGCSGVTSPEGSERTGGDPWPWLWLLRATSGPLSRGEFAGRTPEPQRLFIFPQSAGVSGGVAPSVPSGPGRLTNEGRPARSGGRRPGRLFCNRGFPRPLLMAMRGREASCAGRDPGSCSCPAPCRHVLLMGLLTGTGRSR